MRNQRSCKVEQDVSPARRDHITQQAVLEEVIDLHPAQVTVPELVRRISRKPDDFGERDRIERAVFELAGVGLFHRHDYLNRPDSLITPTQAALCAYRLMMDGDDDE